MSETANTAQKSEIILWIESKLFATLEEIVPRAPTHELLMTVTRATHLYIRAAAAPDDIEEGRVDEALAAVCAELARRIDRGRAK